MEDQIVVHSDGVTVSEKAIQEIRVKASLLKELDENALDQLADMEVFNADIQNFLQNVELGDDYLSLSEEGIMSFSVSEEKDFEVMGIFGRRLRRLKEELRRIICDVINGFGSNGLPSWDEIIRAVLIAVAASFFAGPMGTLLLPIIITIVARILKLGVAAICPI